MARILPAPRVCEILADENDRIDAHAASQIQRGRGDRAPHVEGTLRKTKLREQRIRKQAEAKQEAPVRGFQRGWLNALFRNQVNLLGYDASNMAGVEFARICS